MSLTGKQERRLWRCLEKMKDNTPSNPMDIGERSRTANQNMEAANALASATFASTENWGADEVNGYLREAESSLDLELIEAVPSELREERS
ncbi:MAG TPA: hypothetical protein VD761_11865 [Solirubrobacterales bacterium]|nr:hypothetical protein [Solirubrobacterales bacterium]